MVDVSRIYISQPMLGNHSPTPILPKQTVNIQPLFRTLLPEYPSSQPPTSQQPQNQQPQQPPPLSYLVVVSSQAQDLTIKSDNAAPLDLSCKRENLDIHPRSGSCSSNASSYSSSSMDDERRMKRKEQNKAAAQNYRQRKKSFSELIEGEHDLLARRNTLLKAHKNKLEIQIRRIRDLLDDVVRESKQEPPYPEVHDTGSMSDTMSEPVRPMGQRVDLDLCPIKRARKYSLPSNVGDIRERKKEQNRLASQRFRQRRKVEMSHHEDVAGSLESKNMNLKKKCDEMELKIQLLKDFLSKVNANRTAATSNVTTASPAIIKPVTTLNTITNIPTLPVTIPGTPTCEDNVFMRGIVPGTSPVNADNTPLTL
ncbi:uncharacterized protein LOC131886142 [Tigriopus californicus]|uniref:uncharacterized protein LOC131886142 n=1 Tax=Tigriopus californicus TaxID=6832 RepID=UPI0027DAA6A1|nr:uncharacterized protein LOC131886142 [Tigriopus californicus]